MTSTPATLDDCTLIALALEGESDCFATLITRHLAAVERSIGTVVRSPDNAEDVLQDVLFKVWRRLSTFRAESSFRTWITRVAINEALQSHRRQHTRPICQTLIDPEAIAATAESPHELCARTEISEAIRGAVAALPVKYRQVLILRDLQQLSVKDTAQFLHANVPTVKTRLSRARVMLLASLEKSKHLQLARAA